MNNLFDDLAGLGVGSSKPTPSHHQTPAGSNLFDNHFIPKTMDANSATTMMIPLETHEYKLDIRSMMFVETPGYDDIYHKSHSIHLNHSVMRTLEEMTLRGSNLESNTIAPLAGSIITPAAMPTSNAMQLPGGWHNRRLRFMLTVHYGGKLSNKDKTQYIFGFCEFLDYGNLTPGQVNLPNDMRLFFNHTLTVENSTYQGRANMSINDNSQYLRGDYDMGVIDKTLIPATMRPGDVMRRLQAIESGFSEEVDIVDTRQTFSYSSIAKNNRNNNNSSDYLSRSLKALKSAVDLSGGDLYDAAAIHKRAAGAAPEGTLNEDLFMRALTATTELNSTGYATWGELRKISINNLDAMSQLKTFGHAIRQGNQMHHTGALHDYGVYQMGNAIPWKSRTRGAQIATQIGQQLPGIMIECGIGQIEFVTTNRTFTKTFATSVIPHSLLSFINGGCPPNLLNRFIARLEGEILQAITLNGEVDIELNVFISMDCDSRIFVTVGGGEQEYYVAPQYCDAVLSPIWSGGTSGVEQMAVGIGSLYNTITRNQSSQSSSIY